MPKVLSSELTQVDFVTDLDPVLVEAVGDMLVEPWLCLIYRPNDRPLRVIKIAHHFEAECCLLLVIDAGVKGDVIETKAKTPEEGMRRFLTNTLVSRTYN